MTKASTKSTISTAWIRTSILKILDRYILTTYLKTFLSVFVILMLIFVLQTIWLYIKELAGKDLDIIVVAKFLIYFAPKLIPLVLPLTILLASIMVFGNFAENYEFAAMKSTGISLQRAMAGLSIFIVGLAIVTFFFANNVIPWAEYNSYNLRKNIAKLKPAMVIAEGQFNDIGDITIKVDEKSGDRGQYLKNVILHQKSATGQGNHTTIVAKTGELKSNKDSNVLRLVLFDGNYYDDTPPKKFKDRNKHPFKKSTFETYTINVDLSELNNIDLEEKNISDKYNMLDVSDLSYTIDTLKVKRATSYKELSQMLYNRTSARIGFNKKESDTTVKVKDSLDPNNTILALFEPSRNISIIDLSLNTTKSTSQIVTNRIKSLKNDEIWLNKHIMSLHEKLALGFACIILFFVGAPLGALIRKGGIGLPMVVAILLFLTYHFIGIFAKNSAKDGSFNPILATWFSTVIMFPLSIYLTKRATADQGLFESIGLLDFLKKLFGIQKEKVEEDDSYFGIGTSEYQELFNLDTSKLIEIHKNYRQYNKSVKYKNTALMLLNSRGISNEQLKFGGDFVNQNFEDVLRAKDRYDEDSKLSFVLYFLSIPSIVLGRMLENNQQPLIGNIVFVAGLVIGVVFLFALMKSFMTHSNLNKLLDKRDMISNALLYLLLGLPLYIILYFFQKRKIENDLHLSTTKRLTKKETTGRSKGLQTEALKDYHDYARFGIVFYSSGLVLLVLYFILNHKLPALALASVQLSAVCGFVFLLYYILSLKQLHRVYNKKEDGNFSNNSILLLGFVIYPIVHYHIKKRLAQDFK